MDTAWPTGHFSYLDLFIILAYFLFTTLLGAFLSGRQTSLRDFFLAGRSMPWYAVSASIVATEISALTFVSLPFVVFRPDGNFTYLQLGLIGSVLARILVAVVLVPAYYRGEFYSPYDLLAQRVGPSARTVATVLFSLSGLLAQSARVYMTALVLELILYQPLSQLSQLTGLTTLSLSIGFIGLVAVLWTVLGGIRTVIWTDLILFFVFLTGAIAALFTIVTYLPDGLAQLFREGAAAEKFQLWDWDLRPWKPYTIWTAAIASTWSGFGSYGTDQLLAQRLFCCRSPRQAQWALILSSAGLVMTVLVMLVGVGLYVYYHHYPLTGPALDLYQNKGDRIFPIFILTVAPPGIKGLIIAGIFAAAISSLDSILAALAQTSLSLLSQFRRPSHFPARFLSISSGPSPIASRQHVQLSRALVLLWGLVLCIVAHLADYASAYYPSILDMGLAMAGYCGGALAAGIIIALWPFRWDGRGYLWSAPLSVLVVLALVWHEPWAFWTCFVGSVLLFSTWWLHGRTSSAGSPLFRRHPLRFLIQSLFLLLGIALVFVLNFYGYWTGPFDPLTGASSRLTLAWPWYVPVGSAVALTWGYLLSGDSSSCVSPPAPEH